MTNRFLQGPFTSVARELRGIDLSVVRQIPTELYGRYLRNGPNPMAPDDPNDHWFLRAGTRQGVLLQAGRAESSRNRWVRPQSVAASLGEPVARIQLPSRIPLGFHGNWIADL